MTSSSGTGACGGPGRLGTAACEHRPFSDTPRRDGAVSDGAKTLNSVARPEAGRA
ncbi:hypothetical protein [Streptomyces mutabilis]|uniref:hypothetical protein n=1 Tax=Streptomyces mutabilis TaxID=67332 RepID=UPI001783C749|nr:hypothetical protein [Streptomyces mutabilis]GGQ48996.1 hypothetical protein GCM10010279_68090 [Streptomyces mutabilis]